MQATRERKARGPAPRFAGGLSVKFTAEQLRYLEENSGEGNITTMSDIVRIALDEKMARDAR